jgi:hypothetical protein
MALSTVLSPFPRLGIEYLAWSVLLIAMYLLLVRIMALDYARARIGAFALFARQRDRCPHTLTDKFHQPFDHTFVGVDTSAGKHFTPVARARPPRNLLRTIAVFLIVSNGVIQCCKNNRCKKFAGAVPLLIVKRCTVDEISHHVSFVFALAVPRARQYAHFDPIRGPSFGMAAMHLSHS